MAFYDSVKDRVKDENTADDSDDGQTEDENVAFDELIKKAEERDDEQEQEQEPENDGTEIEDFSQGGPSDDDYGDPSSIELNENDTPQAGRTGSEDSTEGSETTTTETERQEKKRSTKGSETAPAEPETEPEVELHQDGSVGDPGSEPEETVAREESELTVLQEIRNQNEQMLGLLRAIKKNLDQR